MARQREGERERKMRNMERVGANEKEMHKETMQEKSKGWQPMRQQIQKLFQECALPSLGASDLSGVC